MHHHGGTLLCSLCQHSSCTTQLAYGGRRTPRRPVRHTPASPPDYGTSNSLIGGAHSLLVKCRGAMSACMSGYPKRAESAESALSELTFPDPPKTMLPL